jgi:hypothetical protein
MKRGFHAFALAAQAMARAAFGLSPPTEPRKPTPRRLLTEIEAHNLAIDEAKAAKRAKRGKARR